MTFPRPFSHLQEALIHAALRLGRWGCERIRPAPNPGPTEPVPGHVQSYPCGACGAVEEAELYSLDLRTHYRADALYYPDFFHPDKYPTHRIVRCRNCDLVRVNPRVRDEVLLGYYGGERTGFGAAFDAATHLLGWSARRAAEARWRELTQGAVQAPPLKPIGYEPEQLRFAAGFLRYCAAAGGLSGPLRFLDIGCATGWAVRAAVDLGWDGYGLEPHPRGAAHAAENSGGAIQCLFYEDETTWPRGQFDLVISLSVIEHVFQPEGLARYCAAMVRPGGLAVVRAPCIGLRTSRMQGPFWRFFSAEHLHFFDDQAMDHLFSRFGFSPVARVVSNEYGPRWCVKQTAYALLKRALAETVLAPGRSALWLRGLAKAFAVLRLIPAPGVLAKALQHMDPYWFPMGNDEQVWIYRKLPIST